MILIKLQGGLGNQMFQYALGRALSLKHNVPLKLDLSTYTKGGFPGDTPRSFVLNNYAIHADIATDTEIKGFTTISSSRILKKLSSILQRISWLPKSRYVAEQGQWYHPDLHYKAPSTYYFGFWQSPHYFEDYSDIIRSDFTLLNEPSAVYARTQTTILNETLAVSLHIRRGDFVTNLTSLKDVGVCGIEYYERAMAYTQAKIGTPHFFVFSDDIPWAKEHLPTQYGPITFVSDVSLKDFEELLLMKECRHHIIANSSFSWWAAWLDPRKDKIVVRPEQWFVNPNFLTKDYLPPSWTAL